MAKTEKKKRKQRKRKRKASTINKNRKENKRNNKGQQVKMKKNITTKTTASSAEAKRAGRDEDDRLSAPLDTEPAAALELYIDWRHVDIMGTDPYQTCRSELRPASKSTFTPYDLTDSYSR